MALAVGTPMAAGLAAGAALSAALDSDKVPSVSANTPAASAVTRRRGDLSDVFMRICRVPVEFLSRDDALF
jgi:hypothetical protein